MTTVTYHMNRLQALTADREFCVTLNRAEAIDPGKVLRRFSYAHPVFTGDGARAQARRHEISGVNRTHFAGAYWRWGFHEDGVVSAARVGRALRGAPVMYAGTHPPPALRRARARLQVPARAGLARPGHGAARA